MGVFFGSCEYRGEIQSKQLFRVCLSLWTITKQLLSYTLSLFSDTSVYLIPQLLSLFLVVPDACMNLCEDYLVLFSIVWTDKLYRHIYEVILPEDTWVIMICSQLKWFFCIRDGCVFRMYSLMLHENSVPATVRVHLILIQPVGFNILIKSDCCMVTHGCVCSMNSPKVYYIFFLLF